METCKLTRLAGLILAGGALYATAAGAMAAGTAAGTDVTNQATVSFSVGGIDQPDVDSNQATFKVDNKIDLTVAPQDGALVNVSPGMTGAVLEYTVTNTGNKVQDYSLSPANGGANPFSGSDNFDAANVQVFVESGGNSGYQSAEDTATFIDELAPGDSQTVYVVGEIPAARTDGDIAVATLSAQAAEGGGSGTQGADITADDAGTADDPDTVQIVFADGAGEADAEQDGAFSAADAYLVQAAQLTATKSSEVISDPINDTTNPKAIPGAIVEYTITIANDTGAAADAEGIVITDSLAIEIGNGSVEFVTDAYGSSQGIQVTAPNIASGTTTSLSNSGGDDQGDFGITAADTVTVSGMDLAPGGTATVAFQVEIQ